MANDQNTRTLVATFSDYSTARQAARDLMENGIPSDAVHIDSNQKTTGAGSGGVQTEEHHDSGFMGWWNSLFGSNTDEEARHYQGAIESGSTVLRATIAAQSVDTAVDILNRDGATDVDQPTTPARSESKAEGSGPIQVIEEELQVGKRAVRRGGVRVYSHVITEPVEEKVNLHEEHVNVERRKVDREVSPEEISSLRDQTIEVTEMAEEPVISKRARVKEEVVLNKQSTDRTETVRDNVRHTEVEVEQLGSEKNAPRAGSNAPAETVRHAPDMHINQPSSGTQMGGGFTAGAGTLAGDETAGSAIQDRPARDFTSPDLNEDFRQNFQQNYGAGSSFETMRPAYEYGYRYAADPRYKGRPWTDVENDLRTDYERNNPGSKWDQAKGAVRYGWEKVTGRR